MIRVHLAAWLVLGGAGVPVHAARLSLAFSGGSSSPPETLRLDVVWTMGILDEAQHRMNGVDLTFNVEYPAGGGTIDVVSASTFPSWSTAASSGIGGRFDDPGFFFSAVQPDGTDGVIGNGTVFSTVIASLFLRADGDVVGTEITFRHDSPAYPVPAAYDGPREWQLRWQEEVTGPLQFDIGVGNPGDGTSTWAYHGYETYQPLIFPEPGTLALLGFAALALLHVRR